jgi:hypothetical protein
MPNAAGKPARYTIPRGNPIYYPLSTIHYSRRPSPFAAAAVHALVLTLNEAQ